MMKTMWDWLELDATDDVHEIKSAYARQAKKYHPEENPEEFKQLRASYKNAMRYASMGKKATPNQEAQQALLQQARDSLQNPVQRIGKAWPEKPEEPEEKPMPLAPEEPKQEAYAYNLETKPTEKQEEPKQEAYVYNLRTKPPEKPEEPKQEAYAYNLRTKPPEKPKASEIPERNFVYNYKEDDGLGGEQLERLKEFLQRADRIYSNQKMRNDVRAWRMLFSHYKQKNDFGSTKFVAAVVDSLEQMPGLWTETRKYIAKKLFCREGNSAEWQYITERYHNIPNYASFGSTRKRLAPNQRLEGHQIAKEVFGKESKIYRLYKDVTACGLIIFMGVMMFAAFGGRGSRISQNQPTKPHTIDSSVLKQTNGAVTTTGKLKLYKLVYLKDTPYKTDLNGDEVDDFVYYDSKQDDFLVELYNDELQEYELKGSVKEYCESNPSAKRKLERFIEQ